MAKQYRLSELSLVTKILCQILENYVEHFDLKDFSANFSVIFH